MSLLQLEDEESGIKEKIAHLPEKIDRKIHYKNRKDIYLNDKNAFHHDTNRPLPNLEKGAHDQLFKVSYISKLVSSKIVNTL